MAGAFYEVAHRQANAIEVREKTPHWLGTRFSVQVACLAPPPCLLRVDLREPQAPRTRHATRSKRCCIA